MPLSWYSTGSSMVIILISGELILDKIAYRVVDLPLPVGPVTRIIPWEDWINFSTISSFSSFNPSSGRLNSLVDLFNNLSTSRSPWVIGIVETRISILWSPILTSKRPSCGSRFSAIFIFAITLILEIKEDCIHFGGDKRSYKTPSTRLRTLKVFW